MANNDNRYECKTECLTLTDGELKELLEECIDTGAVLTIAAVIEAVLMVWCLDMMNSD